jgi:hypothetical protein
MATVNPSVVRAINTSQDLFTITYPYADIVGTNIAGVSKADPAVVTSQKSLPGTFVAGTAVIITGVGAMTQLATAGESGSDKFYVNPLDSTTFELYSDAALTANVDSTGFTTATANTGVFNSFTVPEYDSVGSTATVLYSGTTNSVGSAISVDLPTGLITLTGGATYSLTGIASVNSAGATYQWYDFTNDVAVGYSQPVGVPVTALFKNDANADLGLVVTAKTGTTFSYPAQITDAQAFVEEVSGFVA